MAVITVEVESSQSSQRNGNIYDSEYPSRPGGYNWPRSYEQYKDQVGQLQDDMDQVFETLEEYEEAIEELEKIVNNLRVQVANKRDK